MSTSISNPPTIRETIRDLLPEIELTPRVVEALGDDNWRLGAGEAPDLAEVAATARALVVRIRTADARRLAEIREAARAGEQAAVAGKVAAA